jgi:hypothetical protein
LLQVACRAPRSLSDFVARIPQLGAVTYDKYVNL